MAWHLLVQFAVQFEQSSGAGAGADAVGCCPIEEWSSTKHTAMINAPLLRATAVEAMLLPVELASLLACDVVKKKGKSIRCWSTVGIGSRHAAQSDW